MHCIARSCSLAVIVLLFEVLDRYDVWQKGYYANVWSRRSLESERLDPYGIGEEICKWKHIDSVVIDGEWGERLIFCGHFYTYCFKNDPTSSQHTIFIAIPCSLVSLDSIRRSFNAWHNNIQWLELLIRSSLVLNISGGKAEMKNDNFSRRRGI